MLEKYFSAPKTLARLRTGPAGPHIDGFAAALSDEGYSHASAVRYLRAASYLGHFLQRKGGALADVDAVKLDLFGRHLPRCRCPSSNGGKHNHHVLFGAKRFRAHLVGREICRPDPCVKAAADPELVICFRNWFQKHRGACESTLRQYSRGAAGMLQALGEDVGQWNAQRIRMFLVDRIKECGKGTAEKLITSSRAFLRYLAFRGLCPFDLDRAVPVLAHWHLAEMPESLTSAEVERLIGACDGSSTGQLRDRAMILLLVRLGLRAGDVAQLRLPDIEWETGTLRVLGKGRYEVRLPLPQDVGDALCSYLERRLEVGRSGRVFLRCMAPFRPAVSSHCVSGVVKRALRRAGIVTAAKGAHLLRHTAATQMLRGGVPLDQIGMVLRHRRIDTTAYYAKVDVLLLRQVARPWPEVQS